MKVLLLLISTILMSTCSNSKKKLDVTELYGKELNVVTLNNNDVSSSVLTMMLQSEANSVNGFAGCNNYFGTYSIGDGTIAFSKIGATKKYCQDTKDIESSYLKTLSKVTHFKQTKDDKIELLDENEAVLIVLKT